MQLLQRLPQAHGATVKGVRLRSQMRSGLCGAVRDGKEKKKCGERQCAETLCGLTARLHELILLVQTADSSTTVAAATFARNDSVI
jgi:hypothetical protein